MISFLHITVVITAVIVLIAIHEYAHYVFAKYFNVRVMQIAIGFGKTLFIRRMRNGCEIHFKLIPIGGYVKMQNTREMPISSCDDTLAFDKQSLPRRSLIILAGPVANLIFCLFAFWLAYTIGVPQPKPIIHAVFQSTPAYEAQLPLGATILEVDHHPVTHWGEISMAVVMHMGSKEDVVIRVRRDNDRVKDYRLSVVSWNYQNRHSDPLKSLGLYPKIKNIHASDMFIEKYSLVGSFIKSSQSVVQYTEFIFTILGKLFTGKISLQQLGGPWSFLMMADMNLTAGVAVFLIFLGYLSLAISLFNLLPIPGLDGGHLMYLAYESIFGRSVSIAFEVLAYRLTFILFVVLMIQMTLNDLLRYLLS